MRDDVVTNDPTIMPHNSATMTISHADVGRFDSIPARDT